MQVFSTINHLFNVFLKQGAFQTNSSRLLVLILFSKMVINLYSETLGNNSLIKKETLGNYHKKVHCSVHLPEYISANSFKKF